MHELAIVSIVGAKPLGLLVPILGRYANPRTMRSQKPIFWAISLALIVLLLWAFYRSKPAREASQAGDETKSSDTVTPSLFPPTDDRSARIETAIIDSNVPMDFFGQVVDSEEDPVEGAQVKLRVQRHVFTAPNSFSAASGDFLIYSDKNGLFSLRQERGHMLEVVDIEKTGYRLAAKQQTSFNVSRTDYSASYSSAKPFRYLLVEEGSASTLFYVKHSLFSDWSGAPIKLDLRLGVGGEGDMEIIPTRGEMKGRRCDWSLVVRMLDGGIVECEGHAGSIAPTEGYSTYWETGFDLGDKGYQSGITADAFVKTSEGLYSRVAIAVYADVVAQNVPSIILRVLLNEEGGRVLDDGSTNSQY